MKLIIKYKLCERRDIRNQIYIYCFEYLRNIIKIDINMYEHNEIYTLINLTSRYINHNVFELKLILPF